MEEILEPVFKKYNLLWGFGIGDWGLGPIPNPQSPIPNPQSPIPEYNYVLFLNQQNLKFIININII